MKPSEYLDKKGLITNKKELIKDLEMRKRFDSYTSPYTNQGEKLYRDVLKIQKLEKDAVDKYKKELKDKIIILFKKRLDDKVINDENFLGFNDFKCDILELLK